MNLTNFFALIANLVTAIIGINQLFKSFKNYKDGHPKKFQGIIGIVLILIPIIVLCYLWINSEHKNELFKIENAKLQEILNLNLKLINKDATIKNLTDSLSITSNKYAQKVDSVNRSAEVKIRNINAQVQLNKDYANNKIQEVLEEARKEIAILTQSHLIETTQVRSELKFNQDENVKLVKSVDSLISENKLSKEQLDIYRFKVGELNSLNDKSIVTEAGIEYYEKGIKSELEGESIRKILHRNKKIDAYINAVKYFKLARDNGFKNLNNRIIKILNLIDDLDRDNKHHITIDN